MGNCGKTRKNDPAQNVFLRGHPSKKITDEESFYYVLAEKELHLNNL